MHVLRQKAADYVSQGHIDKDRAENALLTIEAERGHRELVVKDMASGDASAGQAGTDHDRGTEKLTRAQMVAELPTLINGGCISSSSSGSNLIDRCALWCKPVLDCRRKLM